MYPSVSACPVLHCLVCGLPFDFQAKEAALVLRHVAYGYDFVHDGRCLVAAQALIFAEPGYDCAAFSRHPERRRVLDVAPAAAWTAIVSRTAGLSERQAHVEPLWCWVMVEQADGSTCMEGLVRDDDWLDEPGGAQFAEDARRPDRVVVYAPHSTHGERHPRQTAAQQPDRGVSLAA